MLAAATYVTCSKAFVESPQVVTRLFPDFPKKKPENRDLLAFHGNVLYRIAANATIQIVQSFKFLFLTSNADVVCLNGFYFTAPIFHYATYLGRI